MGLSVVMSLQRARSNVVRVLMLVRREAVRHTCPSPVLAIHHITSVSAPSTVTRTERIVFLSLDSSLSQCSKQLCLDMYMVWCSSQQGRERDAESISLFFVGNPAPVHLFCRDG